MTEDESLLFFISDRGNSPNLWVQDLHTGMQRQISANGEGTLRSYVYFNGNVNRGFGKASVSLDAQSRVAYYLQGHELIQASHDGTPRTLAILPEDQVTAFTHVSGDGRLLCVPTTDARALQGYTPHSGNRCSIDRRVQGEGLSSYLRLFDTTTGKCVHIERVPRAWITHVQFSPMDPSVILYNHEWPCQDCGIRRMWLWDGKRHKALRTEGDGRSRDDWTCHETWQRDGQSVVYHGTHKSGGAYLGKWTHDGGLTEVDLPADWAQYGHFTAGEPDEMVCDGYFRTDADERSGCGKWISTLKVNWAAKQISWNPLLRHGSSWDSQDSHPHPVFNRTCSRVYFTSDRDGLRGIWSVSTH